MTDAHRQVVEVFAAAWDRPEPHAWDELLAEDVELNQPMLPSTRGRQRWQEEGPRLLALLPDLRGEVLSWAAREDLIFIELELSATLGRTRLAFRAVDKIWITPAGRITRRDSFFDSTPVALVVLRHPSLWPRWWRSGVGPLLSRRRFVG